MFLLGFIVSVCFIPGITGALVPTQWAVLSALLPLYLWQSAELNLDHKLGLAFLGWATISVLKSPNIFDSLYGLWIAFIWAGSFWLGFTSVDLRPLWRGIALGLSLSSIVAIAQALGYTPVLAASSDKSSGLFFNSTVLGASCALVLLALIAHRQWLWVPGLLPGLALSQSRGAIFILALTLLATRVRWYITVAVLILALAIMSLWPTGSDVQRMLLWGAALRSLDLCGYGIGSYTTLLLYNPTEGMIHPEFVHNDYLQLWFEFGAFAVLVYALLLRGLMYTGNPNWPVLCGFAILATFYFPLWCPLTAFIGCTATGAIAGWRCRHGDIVHNSGSIRLSWNTARAPRFGRRGIEALSIQSST